MLSRVRVTILNCPIDVLSMNETVQIIDEAIQDKRQIQHGAVDAGKLAHMQKNKELHRYVVASDIINADGQSLVWLSRLYGQHLPERVTGIDLMLNLAKLAYKKSYKMYLFGAREKVVSKVAKLFSTDYSPNIVAGYRNGYFAEREEEMIAREIASSGAQMLFVALTSPMKEEFLYKYRDILSQVSFRMGVGGAFDVIAGEVRRAPLWTQKLCLEWLYRFLQEPREKWKSEVVDSFRFLGLVVREKLKGSK